MLGRPWDSTPLPLVNRQQATILDKMDEKLRPPLPPISMMEKMARFRCSASTSLNWGRGASIFHFILSKIVG